MTALMTCMPRPARSTPASGGPTMLGLLRARRRRIALLNVMFMICGLLALAIAPCQAMGGMQAGAAVHDCPQCPSEPCHDARPEACLHQSASEPTTLPDLPRFDVPVGLPGAELVFCVPARVGALSPVAHCGPAPGRRSHLVFLRFNE